jgi:hypothetical protein
MQGKLVCRYYNNKLAWVLGFHPLGALLTRLDVQWRLTGGLDNSCLSSGRML